MRLTAAAYLIAVTSVSAERLLLSSATTRRPSAPRPRTETLSRLAPPATGSPSNSKVTTLTAGPRMAGLASTHSCRSARCSRPASWSEIICAGNATEPATVKSISSAISQSRLGQTVVFGDVPKVTRRHNRTSKLVARRVLAGWSKGPPAPAWRRFATRGHWQQPRVPYPQVPRRKVADDPGNQLELCKRCDWLADT